MSGHSKWSNIKERKGAQDRKRSAIFTRVTRDIVTAIRQGGSASPENNSQLRSAIDKARAMNLPKENIERIIQKFSGKQGSVLTVVLEGYVGGIPLIIEAETDNKNRTIAEIKSILKNHQGSLGEEGSVVFLFDKWGEVIFRELPELRELELIDLGAEEISGRMVRIRPEILHDFSRKAEALGLEVESSAVIMAARNPVTAAGEEADKVSELIARLEEHMDVVAVYTGLTDVQKI